MVLVVNATTVVLMDEDLKTKIMDIRAEADRRSKLFQHIMSINPLPDLYPMIMLTRIDALCPDTERHTGNVFSSTIIKDMVTD